MTKPRVRLYFRGGGAEAVYRDGVPWGALGEKVEISRFSHVDPVLPPRWWEFLIPWLWHDLRQRRRFAGGFVIRWSAAVRARLGRVTYVDAWGNPLRQKRQAIAEEQRLLAKEWFNDARQQT